MSELEKSLRARIKELEAANDEINGDLLALKDDLHSSRVNSTHWQTIGNNALATQRHLEVENNNLKAKLEARGSAEPVTRKYFVFDPEGNMETVYNTRQETEVAKDKLFEEYREYASDYGYHEATNRILWGEVIQELEVYNSGEKMEFEGEIVDCYKMRWVPENPPQLQPASPAQPVHAAVPDGYVHVDEVIQICKDFSSRTGSIYIGDVQAALTGLLSAAPTPPSAEQSWYVHSASIGSPIEDDVYLVDYTMQGLNGAENIAQAIIHFHPKHGWRAKITPAFAGDTPKDSAYAVKHMVGFKKIFDSEQPDSAAPNGPTEKQIYQWFQESTIAHHIEEDGRHIAKRTMFVAKKSWDAAIAQAKPQRITEQDAREIAINFLREFNKTNGPSSIEFFKRWIDEGKGRTLLDKLNENREPDYKAMADELLSALKKIESGEVMSGAFTHADTVLRYQEIAYAAIAKHEGGK